MSDVPQPLEQQTGVDCILCNHSGPESCTGCGGRKGGGGMYPCKYCQARPAIETQDLLIDGDANEGDLAVQQIIDCGGPLSGGYCE